MIFFLSALCALHHVLHGMVCTRNRRPGAQHTHTLLQLRYLRMVYVVRTHLCFLELDGQLGSTTSQGERRTAMMSEGTQLRGCGRRDDFRWRWWEGRWYLLRATGISSAPGRSHGQINKLHLALTMALGRGVEGRRVGILLMCHVPHPAPLPPHVSRR